MNYNIEVEKDEQVQIYNGEKKVNITIPIKTNYDNPIIIENLNNIKKIYINYKFYKNNKSKVLDILNKTINKNNIY